MGVPAEPRVRAIPWSSFLVRLPLLEEDNGKQEGGSKKEPDNHQSTERQMASVAGAARFALAVALGCAYILTPVLDFLGKISPRSAVLDAAVAVVLVTLPITYLLGVILVFLHVVPAAPVMPPGASRRLAGLACILAFALLAVLLIAFILLVGAVDGVCSPPGCGQQ